MLSHFSQSRNATHPSTSVSWAEGFTTKYNTHYSHVLWSHSHNLRLLSGSHTSEHFFSFPVFSPFITLNSPPYTMRTMRRPAQVKPSSVKDTKFYATRQQTAKFFGPVSTITSELACQNDPTRLNKCVGEVDGWTCQTRLPNSARC